MQAYTTPSACPPSASKKHLGMHKNVQKQAIERRMSEVGAKEWFASMGLQKWHL